MKSLFFLLVGFLGVKTALAAPADSLYIIRDQKIYAKTVRADKNMQLVELKKIIPDITLDIRYATSNNFMRRKMYAQARAFSRLPVALALKKVQAELKQKGYGLKIFDGYRPYAVTQDFYRFASNKTFVADPKKGSKHNRGCAVDLTIIDLKSGKELPMPTPYDAFDKKAAAGYNDLPQPVLKNRALLNDVMHRHGFRMLKNEWWHFDFVGWSRYPLMDIPFEAL
ncbi:MAG: M15 family metallopeptidase [Mucilaginibacter polytrichastri]|nr:M15 family metallopeptidase [Mucilaginibacter polytrichastri]